MKNNTSMTPSVSPTTGHSARFAPVREGLGGEGARPRCRPNVDIRETDRELVLVADVPGARVDTIDVRFENGLLTLAARVEPRGEENRRYLLREHGRGDFERSFRLDERIDVARIAGDYADGVLTLRLPKIEAAQPRKIEIRST